MRLLLLAACYGVALALGAGCASSGSVKAGSAKIDELTKSAADLEKKVRELEKKQQ